MTSAALCDRYQAWTRANGEPEMSRIVFCERLRQLGFKDARLGHDGTRGWRGIGLANSKRADSQECEALMDEICALMSPQDS